jgi:hypothetical protein
MIVTFVFVCKTWPTKAVRFLVDARKDERRRSPEEVESGLPFRFTDSLQSMVRHQLGPFAQCST